ncbi:MAG: CHAP domain-containing protein, partial [Mycobacteriales bacterium]
AKQRGMSDKGLLIAMATAHKESGWFNNPGGDRDSAGLFQQRPSAGWGSLQEVTDPWYATNTFFGGPQPPSPRGLVDVPGWENMTVAQAAEQVQHSGFPSEANYAPHVTAAQAMLAHLNHPIDGVPVAGGTNGDSCNNVVVGGRRAEIVRIARNEIGTAATGAHCTKYGPCDFWCAYFVRWVWQQAGITGPALFDTGWARGVPTEVMASNGVKGSFKVHSQGTRDGNPQPGDALVYGTPTQNGGGTNGHIGIVVEVHPDGKIDSVEGDAGPSPGQVKFIQNIDPATVTNGTPDTYIGGYVAPPGG